MASLQTVLSTFALLQQNLGRPEIVDLIAKNDRITISFRHFMSFGNITEVVLLNTYLKFLKRDKFLVPYGGVFFSDKCFTEIGLSLKTSVVKNSLYTTAAQAQ